MEKVSTRTPQSLATRKWPELVNEDEEAKDDCEFNDDDEDMHADYAGTLGEKIGR